MPVVKVQKAPKSTATKKQDILRLDATLCYFYSAYTMPMAKRMPHVHKVIMIEQAKRLEATKMYNLTQIASTLSPGKKNSAAAKKVANHFKKIMKG